MTPKALLTIVFCAALAVGSTSLIRVSLNHTNGIVGQTGGLLERVICLAKTPTMWAGITFFVLSNLLWIYIIATQPLVTAYPLQIALVFVFNTVSAAYVFSERLTPVGLAGLLCILAGVTMVSCFGTVK
jgi:multidrug transporter EmrE-like cation transporter